MSKYKLWFSIGSGLGKESDEVDLVDDLGYTEKKAEEIIKNESEQRKLFEEWRDENIDQNFGVVKENQEESMKNKDRMQFNLKNWRKLNWSLWNKEDENKASFERILNKDKYKKKQEGNQYEKNSISNNNNIIFSNYFGKFRIILVYKTISDISSVKTLLEFAKLMLIDFILYIFWGVGVQILTFIFGLFKIEEDKL